MSVILTLPLKTRSPTCLRSRGSNNTLDLMTQNTRVLPLIQSFFAIK